MSSVVPPRGDEQQPRNDSDHDGSLPVRWVLIIIVAVAAGFAVGNLAGVPAGVATGLSVAGVFHKIVAKR